MRNPFLALSFSLIACVAHAASLAGGWKGTWTKSGDALPVTVTFDKSPTGYRGSFDSDALQVAGIPFSDISETGRTVHWSLKGDQSTTTFGGTLDRNSLAGIFSDGKDKGTFALVRAALPAAGIRSRDVTFADKDVTLAGTLLLPPGAGRHSAILFLQGSGPEGRWANRYLAKKFSESGFVALIYDKRGVGQSTGDWQKVGFDALANDAVAGVRFLQTQPQVDPSRVGIYGHSQGGTIAPLVAAHAGNLGFVIASAAAGLAPADVETFSVENAIGLSQLPAAEQKDARTYVDALIDVGYRRGNRATLDALAAKYKARDWFFDPPPPGDPYWTIARQIAAFDPAHWWSRVKAPVLLVYGAHDARVPPVASAHAIETALKSGGNGRVALKLYPDADHTFTIVEPAKKAGWPKHEPDYSDTLVRWARMLR